MTVTLQTIRAEVNKAVQGIMRRLGKTGENAVLTTDSRLNEPFPVGSIFISAVATDPATLLGYGTWSAIGAGRVLVGLNSGDTDFDALGETGGAKTVASAGSVAAPTISGSTASEGSHTHSVTSNVAVGNHSFTQPTIAWPAGVPTAANESAHTHTFTDSATAATPDLFRGDATGTGVAGTGTTGAGSAHTHTLSWPVGVPTASGGAVDAHSVTNNAVTSGAGSSHSHGAGTLAASAPAFTGSATSIVQPYLVVKFWQRTA